MLHQRKRTAPPSLASNPTANGTHPPAHLHNTEPSTNAEIGTPTRSAAFTVATPYLKLRVSGSSRIVTIKHVFDSSTPALNSGTA